MEFRVAIVASILFWGCDTPRSSGDLVVIAEDAIPAPDVGMADAVVLMDAAVVDATLDTRVPDAAVVDASPDVQPPAPDAGPMGGFCAPCDGSEDCAPGGACLTNRNINESFCGSACESDVDCPRGATCFTLDDGSQQCVPSGATCVGFPPTDFGADCVDDSQCQNGASVCVAAKDKSYCSRPCESDGDCAVGAQFCRDALCRADWTFGPEGCGRDPDRPLPPCSAEGECPDGLQCLSAILPSLPQAIHPICTRGCESNMDCPGETTCQRLSNGVPHCLPAECRCLARPANQSVLDTTLAVAGLDRCDAGFTRQVMGLLRSDVAVDPFRLSFFNRAHQNGYGGLVWARETKANINQAAVDPHPLTRIIEASAALLDQELDPAMEGQPVTAIEGARALWMVTGEPFPEAQVSPALTRLPADLGQAVGAILVAQARVVQARQSIVMAVDISDGLMGDLFRVMRASLITQPDFNGINMRHPQLKRLLLGEFDLRVLFDAARDLAATIEGQDWDPLVGRRDISVRLETPLGPIVINDAGDQTVSEGETPVLLIDLGGDDRYEIPVAATSAWDRPVSVAIDLAGRDHYGFPGSGEPSEHPPLAPGDAAGRYDGTHPQVQDQFGPFSLSITPRQGAGIMGVGILYDRAGNDVYVSHKLSQGAGILGVGLLMDAGGSDQYTCEQGCQGAGAYGIGALIDRVGPDRYVAVQHVQGYAYVRGVGVLHDGDGNDRYSALMGEPERGGIFLYPNAQNATSNSSFAQGAGFGRRADQSDQVFASGGLGVFIDGGDGNDTYTVDVFGQGTGYWFGTGIFSDGGGDDVYKGRWYVQGSGAHFAMAYFFDEGGDDHYNPDGSIIATAVGQGHDLSLGWLVDYAGDDRYWAPGLGLGGGNDNGIGFFIDLGGTDIYDAPDGTTYGGANIGDRGAAFDNALSLGIFIDSAGTDTYSRFGDMSLIGNDLSWSWSDRREEHKPGAHGGGVDVEDPGFRLP